MHRFKKYKDVPGEMVREYFSEAEVVELGYAVAAIKGWNMLNLSLRNPIPEVPAPGMWCRIFDPAAPGAPYAFCDRAPRLHRRFDEPQSATPWRWQVRMKMPRLPHPGALCP